MTYTKEYSALPVCPICNVEISTINTECHNAGCKAFMITLQPWDLRPAVERPEATQCTVDRDCNCNNLDLKKCDICDAPMFCACKRAEVASKRNALWSII